MALKMADGGQEGTSGPHVQVEEGKETDFPLNPPGELALQTPWFWPSDQNQDRLLTQRTIREYICVVSSHYVCDSFFTAVIEN